MSYRRERSGVVSCFVCHDLPNEHSMALTRPVQCMHALVLSCALHSHSLQLSFFFLPRRHNVAQLRFPQTVNLPPQSRTFRLSLERHASEISKKTPGERPRPRPMPASDRQSGFHHSFFESIFCFFPGPARSAASGAPQPSASAPCFKMLFQGLCVDAGDIITVSVALNYHIYPRFIC